MVDSTRRDTASNNSFYGHVKQMLAIELKGRDTAPFKTAYESAIDYFITQEFSEEARNKIYLGHAQETGICLSAILSLNSSRWTLERKLDFVNAWGLLSNDSDLISESMNLEVEANAEALNSKREANYRTRRLFDQAIEKESINSCTDAIESAAKDGMYLDAVIMTDLLFKQDFFKNSEVSVLWKRRLTAGMINSLAVLATWKSGETKPKDIIIGEDRGISGAEEPEERFSLEDGPSGSMDPYAEMGYSEE